MAVSDERKRDRTGSRGDSVQKWVKCDRSAVSGDYISFVPAAIAPLNDGQS